MNNLGWVKLHRKLENTSFYNKPFTLALFIHLLIKANHQKHAFIWGGKEVEIEAGQLVTGRDELSKQTGISQQSIRTALVNLKSTNTITIKSTTKYSIITILNWNDYQQSTNKTEETQPTSNQQATTYKNDNNEENLNTLEDSKEKEGMQAIGDILGKRKGISTEWQDRAFRYAKKLSIDLQKNGQLKTRWLSLFKTGNKQRLEKSYSFLSDYLPFTQLQSSEDRIKYYFWYYGNKT